MPREWSAFRRSPGSASGGGGGGGLWVQRFRGLGVKGLGFRVYDSALIGFWASVCSVFCRAQGYKAHGEIFNVQGSSGFRVSGLGWGVGFRV